MRKSAFLAPLLIVCLLLPVLAGCAGGGEAVTTEPVGTEPIGTEPDVTDPPATEPPEQTAPATTGASAPIPNAYYSVFDYRNYIKLIGRSRLWRGAILVDWTASGIEFEYQGSGTIRINVEKDGDVNVDLVAVVDGKSKVVTVDENGAGTYVLAERLPSGVHHVLIRRRTMVEYKCNGVMLSIKGIQMTGSFLPRPADNPYKVAFLGDSITCGMGLASYNDGLATYAVDLCTREGFDYDICSISGIGLYCSNSRHGYRANTITQFYPYFNYYRTTTLRYLPDRKADLVIVNLNTNDGTYASSPSDEEPYKAALKTLLSEIREANGENVKIVWVVGMMIPKDSTVNQWLKEVFDELGGESAGYYRIEVETNTSGGNAHPNLASHQAVSRALSAFIRDKGLLDLS